MITTLTPAQLRARHTMKWTRMPADVLPMWVAEMDVETCPEVAAAVRDAAAREVFGYPTYDGRLQDATAQWCARRYSWDVDPDRVIELPEVLTGVRVAIEQLTLPGSPVILPVPAYPPFFDVLDVTGRRGVLVPMLAHTEDDGTSGYRFDLQAIEEAFAAGAGSIVVCNPYNPLGAVFPAEHLAAVCALAERYGARVISDEIHATLVYDRRHLPTAAVSETAAAVTVTITAASKGFNTPGLKSAQLILNNEADARAWTKTNRLRFAGASTLGTEAAIAAYTHGEPWLDELLTFLAARRDRLEEALPAILPGLRMSHPAATYLAWLDFRDVAQLGGDDPSAWLLREARVFLNPGPTFGAVGAGHARLNFATSPELVEDFLARVAGAVRA